MLTRVSKSRAGSSSRANALLPDLNGGVSAQEIR
jgi:hypothetical protein